MIKNKCLAFKICGDKLLFVGGQSGPEGEEAVVVYYWRPILDVSNDTIEWEVLGRKDHPPPPPLQNHHRETLHHETPPPPHKTPVTYPQRSEHHLRSAQIHHRLTPSDRQPLTIETTKFVATSPPPTRSEPDRAATQIGQETGKKTDANGAKTEP
ncbi:hypothetical protein MtrunA17_Chr1g0167701 [Medicago truncatula]|uniref:Uncharacterized protein n=1 Tax=Medicago truncatula TaxID=3880 RepID=G7I4Q5_MEDTR|nr:hypothetical protein MTR_1g043110 [Medicago truncatula]RHN78599.1 hypothetical protein MtrunA17_Chr1g0167701 [Medicago truncatula]